MYKSISSQILFNVLRVAISLISTIFISRSLGPDSYGELQTIIVLFTFFRIIEHLTFSTIIRSDLHNSDDKNVVINSSIVTLSVIILTTIIVAYILINIFDITNYKLIFYIFIFWPLRPINILTNVLNNNNKFGISSSIEFFSVAITEAIKVSLVLIGNKRIELLLLITGSKFLFLAFFNIFTVRKYIEDYKFKISSSYIKDLLKNSFPFFLSFLASQLFLKVDVLMLERMSTLKQVGYYSVAVKLIEPWTFISTALNSFFFNLIVTNKGKDSLQRASTLSFYISTLIAFGSIILLPFIIPFIFGEKYINSIPLARFIAVTLPFLFWYNLQHIWEAKNNYKGFAVFKTTTAALINISLNYLLIPKYNAYGACIATVISYLYVGFFVNILTFNGRKFFRVQLRSIFKPKLFDSLKIFNFNG